MADRWTASALVHSGRPDPVWPVDDGTAERLVAIWERLPPSASLPPVPPPLGFRGVILRDGAGGREWVVFRGVVASAGTGRVDVDGEFARVLLTSAPAGLLPPWAGP